MFVPPAAVIASQCSSTGLQLEDSRICGSIDSITEASENQNTPSQEVESLAGTDIVSCIAEPRVGGIS